MDSYGSIGSNDISYVEVFMMSCNRCRAWERSYCWTGIDFLCRIKYMYIVKVARYWSYVSCWQAVSVLGSILGGASIELSRRHCWQVAGKWSATKFGSLVDCIIWSWPNWRSSSLFSECDLGFTVDQCGARMWIVDVVGHRWRHVFAAFGVIGRNKELISCNSSKWYVLITTYRLS